MIAFEKKPLVAIVTTGGTIASQRDSDGVSRPSLDGDSLIGLIPDAGVDLKVIDLMAKDSASLTLADMQAISNAVGLLIRDPLIDGIVVLHGTDAMEETALLLQLQHQLTKPVVLTGAQFTADDERTDGPANLAAAVRAAVDHPNTRRGVLVCFGGKIHPAWGLYKHATDNGDAFRQSMPVQNPILHLPADVSAVRIDIITVYPGGDGTFLDHSLATGAKGIVLAALGSGNATSSVVEASKRCIAKQIPVVTSSRVPQGGLTSTYGGGGGGHDLAQAGAVLSHNLRPGQARILLASLVAAGATGETISEAFAQSVA
ncbi:asparaginase [Neorhizobium sp. JUb45]|uniref:asparaginase n=1 Tax=unclassified Neorhizobium TaxID=2629175 RepID=UPI0010DEE5E1|nr:asparaginase [Neorhizobium sp. JUb45]TCR02596.1 asparaginase [Neorhizobium sp. JUb45]